MRVKIRTEVVVMMVILLRIKDNIVPFLCSMMVMITIIVIYDMIIKDEDDH